MNGRRVWSPAEDAELRRLRGEGLTCAVIGGAIGRTAAAVAVRGHRLGLTRSAPSPRWWSPAMVAEVDRLRATGASHAEVGAAIGRTACAVKQWCWKNGRLPPLAAPRRLWCAEEDRKLLHLWASDLTYQVIAERMGRTTRAIAFRCQLIARRHATAKLPPAPPADPDFARRTLKGELAIGGENYDY